MTLFERRGRDQEDERSVEDLQAAVLKNGINWKKWVQSTLWRWRLTMRSKKDTPLLLEQKNDLVEAKRFLLQTIEEIDTVAKDTFLKPLSKSKRTLLRYLGRYLLKKMIVILRLLDHENPLESAIEIMAKPKGKRPLTINQLSRWRKTLTATSLLFSIYLLKPAPFCIFDEVDAPLDDANIDKFNNIIKKFSNDSQFIIVTHNKRTMAFTDIIYGITMIEQGVSRVVPVDLRELAD